MRIARVHSSPHWRSLMLAALGVAALLLAGCGQGGDAVKSKDATTRAPDPGDAVIAKVNGIEVRQSDLALAEEDLGENIPRTAAKREYLLNYLADILLAAQVAQGSKVAESGEFQRRLAHMRNKLLAEFALQAEGKAAASEAAMHRVYEEAVKRIGDEQEVRARHILFRADHKDENASRQAEDKIKAVIERLNRGEDFAALANELTEDPAGKQNGGDLDYFTKDQMVPEFSDIAFKLEKGQLSGPVRTAFGWHVLKVEDKRKRKPPEYDQVKDEIEAMLTRRAQAEFIARLRANAKIERLDGQAEPKQ